MSDLIEITDDDRERLRDAARFVQSRTRNSVIAGDLNELATRKPVGDEGVAEARKCIKEALWFLSNKESVRGRPLREARWALVKARAALDQGGSDA